MLQVNGEISVSIAELRPLLAHQDLSWVPVVQSIVSRCQEKAYGEDERKQVPDEGVQH